MMRIGIVGCGHIGTVHSFALSQLRKAGLIDAAVTVTFDTDTDRARRVAEPNGAVVAASLEALADAVDVVWICTWTSAHPAAVSAATERGRAVFCEKPLAPTMAACEDVARQLATVPHQVGLVLRHAPVFREIDARLASGGAGAPLAATLRDDQYFPIQGMYGSTWRGDVSRAGGGALFEHSIHDVDLLAWLLGPIRAVAARTRCSFGHASIEDAANVLATHDSGVTSTLTSVWHQILSRPSTRRLEIFCEDAMLWTEDDYLGPLHIETSAGSEVLTCEPPPWVERFTIPEPLSTALSQYAQPALEFLTALDRDGPGARGSPDVEMAVRAHRVVDAAYRSAGREAVTVAVAR